MAWDTSADCSGARIATGVTPTHCGYTATRRRQEGLKRTPRSSKYEAACSRMPRHSAARCAAPLHEPCALAFALRAPLRGGEGWTIRPRRGNRQGCRFLFAGAGAPSKSPAAPHGLAGFTGQRQVGVPFLLALPPSRWLLFFEQAKKSDPASGRRAEARRPTGTTFGSQRARSRYHHNPRPRAKSLDPCLRRGDGSFEVVRMDCRHTP